MEFHTLMRYPRQRAHGVEIGFDTRPHVFDGLACVNDVEPFRLTFSQVEERDACATLEVVAGRSMRSSACCSRACDCAGSISSRYVRSGSRPFVAHMLRFRISAAVSSRPPAWYAKEESRYRSVMTTAPRCRAGRITSATCCARSAANNSAPYAGRCRHNRSHPPYPRRATAFCESPRPMRCRPARA